MNNHVQMKSLPHSLRHSGRPEALRDAVTLAVFLENTAIELEQAGSSMPDDYFLGMALVASLLRDKIEIGMGEYEFPFGGGIGELEELAHRN